MTKREKRALLKTVGQIKVAAYLVKQAKCAYMGQCANCGSKDMTSRGVCRRCKTRNYFM